MTDVPVRGRDGVTERSLKLFRQGIVCLRAGTAFTSANGIKGGRRRTEVVWCKARKVVFLALSVGGAKNTYNL